jgi:hypothetical protein
MRDLIGWPRLAISGCQRQNPPVEHHQARAEFRRTSRDDAWVLAGVWIDHVAFHPAHPGVEPIGGRLPDTGLLGWADLPMVIAPSVEGAGEAALKVARDGWPARIRSEVPFASRS